MLLIVVDSILVLLSVFFLHAYDFQLKYLIRLAIGYSQLIVCLGCVAAAQWPLNYKVILFLWLSHWLFAIAVRRFLLLN